MIIPALHKRLKLWPIIAQMISIALAATLFYSATKKLLDLEAFAATIQLLPGLDNYSRAVAIGTIIAEYSIGLLLVFRNADNRIFIGLAALMLIYSAAVYYLLHHAPMIPCSCQGGFKDLSWESHLLVNAWIILICGFMIILKHYKRI